MKKYIYLIVLALVLGLVLTGCSLLSNIGQAPATEQSSVTYLTKGTESEPLRIDLLAGQTEDIGDVLVWNDAESLYVKFVYTGTECGFLEVHLQVDEGSFSQDILTKKGNPIPGQFENSYDVGCFTEKLFTYDLAAEGFGCGDVLKIAAHAVVPSGGANVDKYATNVFNVTPGTGAVREPSLALGAPDSSYNVQNFYSLGFGGCIELEFADFVGGTLTVYETTWQHAYENYKIYPKESANIYVSADGAEWSYLGEANNDGQSQSNTPIPNVFNLEECIKYVKICDTTDPLLFGLGANAFDLDAIEGQYFCKKETAWGAGTRFIEKGNWATYFPYFVECCWEEELTIPANGNKVTSTNSLTAGHTYQFVASGTCNWRNEGNSGGYLADAEYWLRNDQFGTGWTKMNPGSIAIWDGIAADNIDWGVLDDVNHIYTIEYTPSATGVMEFYFYDDQYRGCVITNYI